MLSSKLRRLILCCAVTILPVMATSSCATGHLMEWSAGEPSLYRQPEGEVSQSFVRPAGTIAALPVALVWDIVTLPAQWIWGIYPYGDAASPETARRNR
jgi:hypothetical protein